MPEPQIREPAAARHVDVPKRQEQLRAAHRRDYDLSGHGSTIIRGGYGLFYGRIINSTISNAITNVGSASGQISLQLQTTSAGAPTFPNVLASASATPVRPDVVVFADDMQNPMVHEWDAILEQRHRREHDVVGFLRWKRRPQPAALHRREPPQPSGTVSYAAIGGPFDGQTITTPIFTGRTTECRTSAASRRSRHLVDSKYNGLVLQVNRRLNKGLQFQASYTEARATDNGQSSQTFTSANNVLNPFELGLEEGTSNFEIRHRFVANAIWMPKAGAEGSA